MSCRACGSDECMTPHDAATRGRMAVTLATAQGCQWSLLGPAARESFMRQADSALSALHPPQKGWVVSCATQSAWVELRRRPGETLATDLRDLIPHLLRDLADGVTREQLLAAWNGAPDDCAPDVALRHLIRALADMLEGKA